MIALFMYTALLPTGGQAQILLTPIFERRGFHLLFARSRSGNPSVYMDYKRSSDGMLVVINFSQSNSPKKLEEMRKGFAQSPGPTNPESSPSNIPLGDFSFVIDDGTIIDAAADGLFARVAMPTTRNYNEKKIDTRLLEAAERIILAECIGSKLRNDGKPAVNQDFTVEHTHRSYALLPDLAKLNNVKSTIGEWGDRASFSVGKHKFDFALGSDAVYVDGRLETMEAFVARKNGVWMIPKKTLSEFGVKVP